MRADAAVSVSGGTDLEPAWPLGARELQDEDPDIDELVRTARAEVAMLSLRLRAAQHEVATATSPGGVSQLDAVRASLAAAVENRMRTRRGEMSQELDRARSDASRLVLSARAHAAALIAAAGERSREVLLAVAVSAEEEPAPVRALPDLTAALGPAARSIAPRVAAQRAVPPSAQRPPPIVDPADEWTEPVPVVRTPRRDPQPHGESPRLPSSRWSQLIYVDVLLPMVAVLVVLVVLLAWIG